MKHLPKTLLVANRAEIACRVFKTCLKMNIRTVAVYTPSDIGCSSHMLEADDAIEISNYLSINEIVDAAKRTNAQAVHPGYGFLSENPQFADRCNAEGLVFIGPSGDSMRAIGDKSRARQTADAVGVPITSGLGPFTNVAQVVQAVKQIGLPVMLKAAAGGGGKGMKLIQSFENIEDVAEAAQRETASAFGDDRLIVEQYLNPVRHIEVQLMADGEKAIALGERECSLQRRHQKLIEESPSMAVSNETREKLFDSARRIAESVGYKGAGTCEFLVTSDERFYFLEVNARLQVEHPVTELCTGLDLVQMQIETAFGKPLPAQNAVNRTGFAIEARLCAEDPWHGFLPSAGRILFKRFSNEVRVDEGVDSAVSPHYDSLIAKMIAYDSTSREAARLKLIRALEDSAVIGVATNQEYLIKLLQSVEFQKHETYTTTVDAFQTAPDPPSETALRAAALIMRGPTKPSNAVFEALGTWRLA